jgi:hypothetical protein
MNSFNEKHDNNQLEANPFVRPQKSELGENSDAPSPSVENDKVKMANKVMGV